VTVATPHCLHRPESKKNWCNLPGGCRIVERAWLPFVNRKGKHGAAEAAKALAEPEEK
jgi:hypothetical protein